MAVKLDLAHEEKPNMLLLGFVYCVDSIYCLHVHHVPIKHLFLVSIYMFPVLFISINHSHIIISIYIYIYLTASLEHEWFFILYIYREREREERENWSMY